MNLSFTVICEKFVVLRCKDLAKKEYLLTSDSTIYHLIDETGEAIMSLQFEFMQTILFWTLTQCRIKHKPIGDYEPVSIFYLHTSAVL